MLKFYYNTKYKYTNRTLIDLSNDTDFKELNYENIDSPDTINGHIIYELEKNETIPTYVVDTDKLQRWFVSGITQLRTGKFQISLIRDILSENEFWKNEDAYIEAGTATDYCKYKKWGLPFTNTKIGQERLNFGGKSSFFVFYVNERQENGGSISESDFTVDYTTLPGVSSYDIALNNLNEIPHFDFVNAGQIRSWSESAGKYIFGSFDYGFDITYSKNNNSISTSNLYAAPVNALYTDNGDPAQLRNAYNGIPSYSPGLINDTKTAIQNFLTAYQNNIGQSESQTAINDLDAYINKIIRIPTGTPGVYDFYKITKEAQTNTYNEFVLNIDTTSLDAAIKNIAIVDSQGTWTNRGTGHFYFQSVENLSTYTLQSLGQASTFVYTFKGDTRKLPKSSVRCVNIVSDNNFSDQLIMQTLMLSQTNPNVDEAQNVGRIVDIQYLPFSIATTTNSNFAIGGVDLTAEFIENDDFSFVTNLGTMQNVNKETDSIVIVSPSRKSQFKFSPYNTDGLLEFTTKITIRPNQSVIYVRPTTKGLLLQDWDDKECLIIQEDFSLTKVDSAWTQYVYNNRNFQNAFNLQMETKEFERGWERRVEQEQAKADEWTARTISAQKAQTYTGGLPLISNIAGAIGSAWADSTYMQMAQLDREYNEALYQKSVEVARSQFSYQIENVKSQPLIPNTITVIDIKMLDGIYLEYYGTNPTEQQSIAYFYQYNGNRIENYGTFATYYGNFIKGKLIRSINYTQPEVDEVNRRLELGIFTQGV